MRKLGAVILAMALVLPTISCAAEATKEQPKQEQSVKAPSLPGPQAPKAPTLDELKSQRIMLQLRIEGAEAARNSVQQAIDKGRVDLELLDRQIQAMTPKREEGKK